MIQTKRLLLFPVTPASIRELFTVNEKHEIIRLLGGDEGGYEKYKMMYEKGTETFSISMHYFLLRDKETDAAVGECGFHTLYKRHHKAALFYTVHEPFRKRGLAAEAVSAVLDFGFKELQLHRIEAFVSHYNTPSVKLLQRFGFTKESTVREDYLVDGKYEDSDSYSLLKWEWENSN